MDVLQVKDALCQHRAQFERYFELLCEWNEKMNLTAITDLAEAEVKHFEDSLYAMDLIPPHATVCDVGSGAGFPGVPLKIVRQDIDLTLIDSLNKRVTFLTELTKTLGVEAKCLHMRAEEAAAGSLRESFDAVVARAVARLNTLCEYCLPLVKVGGRFIAYKTGDNAETDEAKNAVALLGGKIAKTESFCLSNGDARCLVVIEKLRETPKKYPRGKGKERSRPL